MKLRYLVSTKKPGLEFRITAKRTDENNVLYFTLVGANGIPFERVISQEVLDKYGYAIDVRELPDPPTCIGERHAIIA